MSERRIRKVGSMDQSFIFEVDGKKNINERDNDDDSRAFVEQMILGNNPFQTVNIRGPDGTALSSLRRATNKESSGPARVEAITLPQSVAVGEDDAIDSSTVDGDTKTSALVSATFQGKFGQNTGQKVEPLGEDSFKADNGQQERVKQDAINERSILKILSTALIGSNGKNCFIHIDWLK